MRVLTIAITLGATILWGGCASRSQVRTLQSTTENLRKEIVELKSEVALLHADVAALKADTSLDEFIRDMDSTAFLTPGSEGYAIVQTDLGRMTVSLENIQPYANGSRVTLCFGNLTSATVNDVKLKLEWGSVDAKGSPKNESARSRDVSFTQSLRAGAWTNVSVVLDGVPPQDLGFVRVKQISHTGISLLRD